MPGIYKFFTAIVALIGNVSLVSTGEMNPAFSFIGTGLLWGYYRSLKNYPVLPWWGVGSVSLTAFIVFLIDFYISGDMLISVAQMTLNFQTIKSFDIKDTWDPPQVFFVSLLQLLIASELTHSISFGIVFILFLVFIVVSVLLGHFVREKQKTFRPFAGSVAVVTVITLVLTVIVFIITPRIGAGLWGKSFFKGFKTTGFSERVDFGSFGRVKQDETVIARMILKPDTAGPHYLRGVTFDYFDGVAWYDTIRDTRRLFRTFGDFGVKVPDDARKYEAEIYLEPMESDVVFTIRQPYRIESPGYFIRKNTAGSFYMRQKYSKRFNYKIFSTDGHYFDDKFIDFYFQYPEKMDSIEKLSMDITYGIQNDMAKASKLREYLFKNYGYSLYSEEPDEGLSPVEHFLVNSKRGYCEHFATALTLMLRSVNIPARLVTGFMTSQKNDFGDYYLIRQSDAHSWVEAYIGKKWIVFDPTPPVITKKKMSLVLLADVIRMNWNRYVVGFSNYDQRRIMSYFIKGGKPRIKFPDLFDSKFVFALVAGLLIFIAVRLRKGRFFVLQGYGKVSSEYAKFRKRVRRSGGKVAPSSTSDEVLREALQTGKFNIFSVEQFIRSYKVLRFSGEINPGLLRDYFDTSRQLNK